MAWGGVDDEIEEHLVEIADIAEHGGEVLEFGP